jgi:predicted hotdog family 3-hydroxylacyl-ACP dehydratase
MRVASLSTLIPHAGAMRLLHDVVRWDTDSIECRATSHRDPDNPLRIDDRLPALAGVEYGAQAMAIHGALLAAGLSSGPTPGQALPAACAPPAAPAIGMLVAAHDVVCHVARLDDVGAEITVYATRLLGSARQGVYEFVLAAPGVALLRGRASVMLSLEPP